eukprot:883642-Alexandrium_andersonii.AAC.1
MGGEPSIGQAESEGAQAIAEIECAQVCRATRIKATGHWQPRAAHGASVWLEGGVQGALRVRHEGQDRWGTHADGAEAVQGEAKQPRCSAWGAPAAKW